MTHELISSLRRHRRIGVFSHIRPDGDAIGSNVAMNLWLQKHDITSYAFSEGEIPDNLKWLRSYFTLREPEQELLDQCDAFIFLDGNAPERFGRYADYLRLTDRPIYLIDHHPDVEWEYEVCYSVPEASSTAELVYTLFRDSNPDLIDHRVAKALYTGIMTDTGSFRFDTVTAQTHHILADLIERGKFVPEEVHGLIYDNRSLSQLHLLGKALNNVELHYDGRIGTMCVTREMLRHTGCSYADLEGFVAYPLSLRGVRAAVMLCEFEGKVKLSMRGKNGVDVNKVARSMQGGGHEKAAGAWHPGPLDAAISRFVELVSEQISRQKNGETTG